MLWSNLKGYRSLDQLHQADRQLAEELRALGVELERLALSSRRILLEAWEKAIEQVRRIEGVSNFLGAVPFSTLRTAAVEGPVTLINISLYYRSDATVAFHSIRQAA